MFHIVFFLHRSKMCPSCYAALQLISESVRCAMALVTVTWRELEGNGNIFDWSHFGLMQSFLSWFFIFYVFHVGKYWAIPACLCSIQSE